MGAEASSYFVAEQRAEFAGLSEEIMVPYPL